MDTGVAEACADFVEVCVVVPGVADEFPCAFWHVLEKGAKEGHIDVASGDDAEGAVGGFQSGFLHATKPIGAHNAKQAELKVSL